MGLISQKASTSPKNDTDVVFVKKSLIYPNRNFAAYSVVT